MHTTNFYKFHITFDYFIKSRIGGYYIHRSCFLYICQQNNNVIISVIGNATHTPVIPQNLVNIHINGISMTNCRDRLMYILYFI